MIKNYANRRPQSFIYQNKEVVEDTITENDNAFIFGPVCYDSNLDTDAANINIFGREFITGSSAGETVNAVLLFKGIPQPKSGETITEVVQSGKIVAYKVTKTDAATYYYIIPNTDIWNKFTEENSDWGFGKTFITIFSKNASDTEYQSYELQSKPSLTNDVVTVNLISDYAKLDQLYVEMSVEKAFNESTEVTVISSTEDIRNNFGIIIPENPLAFGCSLALANAGKSIFADTVGGSDSNADSYAKVLGKIEKIDTVQFLCPVFTDDGFNPKENDTYIVESVRQNTLAHVEAMSSASAKRWRRAYIGSPYTTESFTVAEVKENVIAEAIASNSDRSIVVWTDAGKYLTDEGLKTLKNDFLACAVAGLRSSKLPQQGLTRQSISGLSSAPNMYTKWNDTSLDEIAANGVFIITQDYKNKDVYIRHQLTTDTNDGLLYWEDSIGVNVDEISYMAKDITDPYIGKRNATSLTLDEINNKWYSALLERTNVNTIDTQIGPQIVQIVEGSVKTYVDKNMKDRIILTATLVLPLPINTIVVYINAVASL